jgi:hypothetical protein
MVFLKPKQKKKLTRDEEFKIMKMVLDKFLWLGTVFLGIGAYDMITNQMGFGAWFLGIGIVLMLLFMVITVQTYEWIR